MARRLRISLTTQIFIGLGLGIIAGFLIHRLDFEPEVKAETIAWVRVLSRVFLSLIKVIIAPPIFSTLVVGIAGAGSFKEIGRIGLKALIYFEVVTTLALFIGLGAVNLVKPGLGVNLPRSRARSSARSQLAPTTSPSGPRRQYLSEQHHQIDE
jgi:Na+/H+-dicarboxylate symporter